MSVSWARWLIEADSLPLVIACSSESNEKSPIGTPRLST